MRKATVNVHLFRKAKELYRQDNEVKRHTKAVHHMYTGGVLCAWGVWLHYQLVHNTVE